MDSAILVFMADWSLRDTRKYSQWLFVFGDNWEKKGKKGQAVIRDAPNAMGIPTKKCPRWQPTAFLTDGEYDENIRRMEDAFQAIQQRLEKEDWEGVILPAGGIGTGFAQLPRHAPMTYQWLRSRIEIFKEWVMAWKKAKLALY